MAIKYQSDTILMISHTQSHGNKFSYNWRKLEAICYASAAFVAEYPFFSLFSRESVFYCFLNFSALFTFHRIHFVYRQINRWFSIMTLPHTYCSGGVCALTRLHSHAPPPVYLTIKMYIFFAWCLAANFVIPFHSCTVFFCVCHTRRIVLAPAEFCLRLIAIFFGANEAAPSLPWQNQRLDTDICKTYP